VPIRGATRAMWACISRYYEVYLMNDVTIGA
jgi:hypothetical protein